MAIVPVTRIPSSGPFGWIGNLGSLVLVLLAVPVGMLLIGAPLALLIKGILMLVDRIF
jgi:hypothetical protein